MSFLISKKLDKIDTKPLAPKKSLLKDILKISVPAALETFLIGMITMFDTMMVGSINTEAIASVSITQQPVFITLLLVTALNIGVIACISRRRGQNDQEGANKIFRNALVLGLIMSIVVTIISLCFSRPFLLLAGANSDTIDGSVTYFNIVSSVLVFNYLRLIICSAQRAIGKTKTTLVTNVVANLVNIILNYLLIGGNFGFPRLGIAGAAIATVIGNIVAFIIAFATVYRNKKSFVSFKFHDDWKIDKKSVKSIYFVSSNAFVEQLFMRIGFFLAAMIVNYLGTRSVSINTITNSIIALSFNITDGFSIGVSSLVGRSLGEENPRLAYAYGRLSQIISFCLGIIMIFVVIALSKPLSALFSSEQDIINESAQLLNLAAFIIIPQSLQWVTTGILRGSGDSKYTARSSMISVMIVRPVLSLILCYPLGLGLYGAWLGMFIDQALRFYLNNRRFQSLKWINYAV